MGLAVVTHDERFPQKTKDPDWLAEAGRQGWVVLTKDKHIRTRRNELAALLNAGLATFVLTSGNLKGEQMALAFLGALDRIRRLLDEQPRPFIARVTSAGSVDVIALRAGST